MRRRATTVFPTRGSAATPWRFARSLAAPGSPGGRVAPAAWHRPRLDPDHLEEEWLRTRGHRLIAGVDEVGRGCLAGPVVAGAVILPRGWTPRGLRDSKLLRADERERLAAEIRDHAVAWGLGLVEPQLIDRINILQATLLASQLAVAHLAVQADALILDSLLLPDLLLVQRAVVGADRLCASVAAASVIAKVARDRLMVDLDRTYPGYELARNKGYAAPEHRRALADLGPTPIHRRSFISVAEAELQQTLWADSTVAIPILADPLPEAEAGDEGEPEPAGRMPVTEMDAALDPGEGTGADPGSRPPGRKAPR